MPATEPPKTARKSLTATFNKVTIKKPKKSNGSHQTEAEIENVASARFDFEDSSPFTQPLPLSDCRKKPCITAGITAVREFNCENDDADDESVESEGGCLPLSKSAAGYHHLKDNKCSGSRPSTARSGTESRKRKLSDAQESFKHNVENRKASKRKQQSCTM